MRARRQRRPRRAAQHPFAAVAPDHVGHVGVPVADRLGLQLTAARGRARPGTLRAGAGSAAAEGRVRPPLRWVSTIEVTPFDRKVSIRGATNWRAARSSTEPAFPHTAGHPPPHATTFPDPPPRRVVLACRRVRVAPPDRHLRGAARAAVGVLARGDARPDHRLRRHPRPPARVLARLRAGPGLQDQAELRRVRPQRLSGGQVGQPRRADRGRQGQGRAGHADAHRPGPEVGDQEQEGQPHGPGPEGVRRSSRPRSAAATAPT